MSFTHTVTYDTSSSFSISTAANVAFTSSMAQLALMTNMGQTFTEAFSTSTGFTYSTTAIGFTSGSATQLLSSVSGALCWANFQSGKDLNYGVGTVDCTLVSSAVVTGGSLFMENLTTSSWRNLDGANFSSLTQGAFEVEVSFGYNGTPSAEQYIVDIGETITSNNNRVTLSHKTNGQVTLLIRDNGGTSFISALQGALSTTADQVYIFSVNWDIANGATYVFVDGVMFGATITGTGTRDATGYLILGGDKAGDKVPDMSIDNFVYYSTGQRTANYTATTLDLPYRYSASRLQLPDFSNSSILAFDTVSSSEVGSPKYTLDGKYWTGSTFTTSDNTYAQANTIGALSTNIANLGATNTVSVDAYFPDSETISSVSNFEIGYSDLAYPTTETTIEPLSGVATDSITSFAATITEPGSDRVGFIAKVGSSSFYHDGSTWTSSDGSLSQSNTPTEINTNRANLSTSNTVVWIAVLKSNDGTTTPDITSYAMGYDFFRNQSTVSTCAIGGYVLSNGSPVENATVRFESQGIFYLDGNADFIKVTYTTNANGYYEATLPQTAAATAGDTKVMVVVNHPNVVVPADTFRIIVPASTSADIEDTITE